MIIAEELEHMGHLVSMSRDEGNDEASQLDSF